MGNLNKEHRQMTRTIREDVGKSINLGQSVFDKDGSKVGYVDLADKANGWMKVGVGEFEVKSYYVPYRLVTNADEREVFVSVTKEELRNDYSKRPPRTTVVNHDAGKPIATTTEPSGYDGRLVFVREVNLDK